MKSDFSKILSLFLQQLLICGLSELFKSEAEIPAKKSFSISTGNFIAAKLKMLNC
jgi:hypothetical protein